MTTLRPSRPVLLLLLGGALLALLHLTAPSFAEAETSRQHSIPVKTSHLTKKAAAQRMAHLSHHHHSHPLAKQLLAHSTHLRKGLRLKPHHQTIEGAGSDVAAAAAASPKFLGLPQLHHRHQHQQHQQKNKRVEQRAATTIPLEDYYQFLLIGNLSIGTPPQSFALAFDSFYPDLYVLNKGAVVLEEGDPDVSWPECCSGSGSGSVSEEENAAKKLNKKNKNKKKKAVRTAAARRAANGNDDDGDYNDGQFVPITGHNEFNSNASSTFQPVADANNSSAVANYTDLFQIVEGTLGSDTVALGDSLSAKLTFGLVDTVLYDFILDPPVDGALGLQVDTPNGELTPALKQLVAQLDEPVITKRVNRSITDVQGGDGSITLGGRDVAHCEQSTRTSPSNTSSFGYPYFNVSQLSFSNANETAVKQINYTAVILDSWWPILVDNATQALFIAAANASQLDTISGFCDDEEYPLYSLPCSSLPAAVDVQLGAENGAKVVLQPRDYIIPYYGTCYLWVLDERILTNCYNTQSGSSSSSASTVTEEDYGDGDGEEEKWFVLGQQYLNNHCVTTNIESGEVDLTNVIVQQAPVAETTTSNPTPSPSTGSPDNSTTSNPNPTPSTASPDNSTTSSS